MSFTVKPGGMFCDDCGEMVSVHVGSGGAYHPWYECPVQRDRFCAEAEALRKALKEAKNWLEKANGEFRTAEKARCMMELNCTLAAAIRTALAEGKGGGA